MNEYFEEKSDYYKWFIIVKNLNKISPRKNLWINVLDRDHKEEE